MSICRDCARRRWLLERLAGHIERERGRVAELLAVDDRALIALLGGRERARIEADYDAIDDAAAAAIVAAGAAVGLATVCRCDEAYPGRLTGLRAPPAVLSINGSAARLGDLCAREAVAIVGTRRPSPDGLAAATTMARELCAAGLTVVSGMALGIDSAAHTGALEAGGRTIAVLAGAPQRPYPASKRVLFRRILEAGVVLGELGPQARTWRWALQARNRLIAGLAEATIMIEGRVRSGAMITVGHAGHAGRWIGAQPGPVGMPQSAGPNLLLAKAMAGREPVERERVRAVRDAQDVLDLIYGEGILEVPAAAARPQPSRAEAMLLARIGREITNVTMIEPVDLAALSGLELKGLVTRGAGGSLTVLPGLRADGAVIGDTGTLA